MNVSYKWLRDYVKTDLPPEEAARILSHVGLNVDSMEPLPDGDVRFDVEVTSNRPDCLGHIGLARELAAAIGGAVNLPDVSYAESDEACESLVRVDVAEPDLCPLYTARLIRGVKIGPSPEWLGARLDAAGIRPVNNVVDVTNFVMMECGQPLHAFDHTALAEGRIVVRRAGRGERFIAIDHSEHTLSPDRLVIADARRPVALAGVMGGADTEISDATRDVLLEAAVFDPLSIRTTARSLGMASESSYRFERRVDPRSTDWASRRACQLIALAAGGRVARGVSVAGKFTRHGGPLPPLREISLRVGRIETVLGLAVAADVAARILSRLGLEVLEAGPEILRVRVPSWRPDLEREIDLVEEVARHHGYEKIPERARISVTYAPPSKAQRVREEISAVLVAAGYFEAVSFSFTSPEKAARLASAQAAGGPLALRGTPLVLRQSVLPGLLDGLRVNQNAGDAEARLFEIATRFIPSILRSGSGAAAAAKDEAGDALPQEDKMLALASWDDFAAVKGVIEAVVERLRLGPRVRFAPAKDACDLDSDAAAEVLLDGSRLGVIGRATRETADLFELEQPPTVAELIYDRLVEAARLDPSYRPLPQYPAIARDLALVVDEQTPWHAVAGAIEAAGVAEVESVRPLDVYRGKQVPAGKKSLALRLVLRKPTETLTHEEADRIQAKVLASLKERVGATLRQ